VGQWYPIETAPSGEDVLLACKYEPQHLHWRYGVGRISKFMGDNKVLWDWPWSCAPQFWQRINPPTGDRN
jgi:hypothetical protein